MKHMELPERVVCCTLCLCMAVSVFSSVALVYLTALVYMPAKREMMSALIDVPVMCTTIERLESSNCDWYSCGEWCLSRASQCTKLWAHVRKNGTDMTFKGCSNFRDVTCMVLDNDFVEERSCSYDKECTQLNDRFFEKCHEYDCGDSLRPFRCDKKAQKCVSTRQSRNCKQDDVCTNLQSLFLCQNGLCENITSAYTCSYGSTDPPLDCKDKRNCIGLQGLYNCDDGKCVRLHWPWHCERRCRLASTGPGHNVLLLSGDKMVSANCSDAVMTQDLREKLWSSQHEMSKLTLLMASCTDVDLNKTHGIIKATDCVNGTQMPRSLFPSSGFANYTLVHDLFKSYGSTFPLDRNSDRMIPFDTEITIYNRTKLLINTDACVNTLSYECTEFYLNHRRDGRNYSRHDRFPCYYTPLHSKFVTTRFSLEHTRDVFLISFAIPVALWFLSCSCLFGCSKALRVDDDGQMRVRCRKRRSSPQSLVEDEIDEDILIEQEECQPKGEVTAGSTSEGRKASAALSRTRSASQRRTRQRSRE